MPSVYDNISNYDIPETDYRFSNRCTGDVPVYNSSPYLSPYSRQSIPNRLPVPNNSIAQEHTLRFDDIKEISMVKLYQLDNYDYSQHDNNAMYNDSLLKPVIQENKEYYNTIDDVKNRTLEELSGPKLEFSKDLRQEHEMLKQSFTSFNQQFMKPSFQTQNTFDFESPDINIFTKEFLHDVDICKKSISPPVEQYHNKYQQNGDDSNFERNHEMDLANEKIQDIKMQSNQRSIEESIIKVLEQYSEKSNEDDVMYHSNLRDFTQKCESDIQNLGRELNDDVQKEAKKIRSLATDGDEKNSMFEGIGGDNLNNEHRHKDDKISSFIVFGLPKSAKLNNKSAHVGTDIKPSKKYLKTKDYGTKFVNQNMKSVSTPSIKPSDRCLKSSEKPYIYSCSKAVESSTEKYLPQIVNCEEFKKKIAALQQDVQEDKLNDARDIESINALFEKHPEVETTDMKSEEIHDNYNQIGINNDSKVASIMKSSEDEKSNIQTMNPILSNNRKLTKESKYICNLPSNNSSIVDNQTNKEEIIQKDSEHTQPVQYSETSQTINSTIRTRFEIADKNNSKTCKTKNLLNDQDLSKDKTKIINIVGTDKTASKTYKKNKMTVNNQIESQKEQETPAQTVIAKKETRWNNHRHARQSEAYKKYTLTIDNEDKIQVPEGQTTLDSNKSEAESKANKLPAIETDLVPDSRRQRREIKKTLGSYKHRRRSEKRAKWKTYKPPQQCDGDDHK